MSFLEFSRLLRTIALVVFALAGTAAWAQTYSQSVLYRFPDSGTNPAPLGLIQAADGNFYGATFGTNTIFKLTPAGKLTTIYTFDAAGEDGLNPYSGVIQGGDGNFYGTTYQGGSTTGNSNLCGGGGCGTVFKVTPAGVLTTLHTFCSNGDCSDGQYPFTGLVEGNDGNFYGMTSYGGNLSDCSGQGCGTVFKLTPSGAFTSLYSFTGGADGASPQVAPLLQGSDGNFYGETQDADNTSACPGFGCGTIFKISSTGSFSSIYTFTGGSDGFSPVGLVEGADANFYGVTSGIDYPSQYGTIFKLTPSGTHTKIYSFTGGSDGAGPDYAMALGSDGNFYGIATSGGNVSTPCGGQGCGTFFKVSPTGSFKLLYSFCSLSECSDGYEPLAPPIQGADGNLYGTTLHGGETGFGGVAYEIAATPALSAPIQLAIPSAQISLGSSVSLSWKVLNAFSTTAQQCNLFQTLNGAITALGKQTGTLSQGIYSGSISLTPVSQGSYTYAMTCGGQESGYAALTVMGEATSTALTATPNPATVGQTVSLTASVAGSEGVPTGKVAFTVGAVTLGTAVLNGSGVAALTASSNGQAAGTYPVIATYEGNATYDSSVSSAVTVTLNKAPTATALTASPMSVAPPADVALTATVHRTAGSGTPAGMVTFSVGSIVLASKKLNGDGVAIYSASSAGITAGTYPITAKYEGDASDSASTSTAVSVTVQ